MVQCWSIRIAKQPKLHSENWLATNKFENILEIRKRGRKDITNIGPWLVFNLLVFLIKEDWDIFFLMNTKRL